MGAVALFLFGLLDPEAWSVFDLGPVWGGFAIALVAVAIYAATALGILLLQERERRAARLAAFAGIVGLLALGLANPLLVGLSRPVISSLLLIAALRALPRFTLVVLVLSLAPYGFDLVFASVLCAVGLLLIPAPVAGYLRELVPRRVRGA